MPCLGRRISLPSCGAENLHQTRRRWRSRVGASPGPALPNLLVQVAPEQASSIPGWDCACGIPRASPAGRERASPQVVQLGSDASVTVRWRGKLLGSWVCGVPEAFRGGRELLPPRDGGAHPAAVSGSGRFFIPG